MAEKYVDLHGEIADSIHWDATVADTLKWLDDHPDRAPARTMTVGEMDHKCTTYGSAYETGFKQAGGQVVPDPEPTNAEELVEDLAGIYGANLNWTAKVAISEALTERGWVKAPGGD